MSAQFVDALKGYDFFLDSRGQASRQDVNDYLYSIKRKAISLRTYGHYKKLITHGFRSYIPINQFDVFQALGQLQAAADRRRYERLKDDSEVYLSKDMKKWSPGKIIDRSLVGFGLLTDDRFPIRTGSQIWIKLKDYGNIPMMVVWRNHLDESTRIGTRAFEFIAKYRIIEEERLPPRRMGLLRIVRKDAGELDWANLFRILAKTNELLEATADLLIAIEDYAGLEIYLEKPKVTSMRFGSPGEIQIKVDFGIAEIIKVVAEKLQFWREQKEQFISETEKIKVETVNLAIEAARNAIRLRKRGVGIWHTS